MTRGAWASLGGIEDHGRLLMELAEANRGDDRVGVFSVCSAHPMVLDAAMRQALRDGTVALIESTSNQVNQSGGYTGMTPSAFRAFVRSIATSVGLDARRVILGGDHLGPHPWRNLPAEEAMGHARRLVRDCVLAGYVKIHLDASMRLADDPPDVPLDEDVAARRSAELCAAAEAAWRDMPAGAPAPVYVVGTEVPIPGGEVAGQAAPAVTRTADLERTLSATSAAFERLDLASAWERVVAVVVQPGVEFGDTVVFPYVRGAAAALSRFVENGGRLVFEAHSTDYQSPRALAEMVEDHFAILKVGPGLTFAFREAVYALEAIERELPPGRGPATASRLRETLQRAMAAHPEEWQSYYRGGEAELRFARDFSLSDRSRYYWPRPEVQAAVERLFANLRARPIPPALLSQYLPLEYRAVRAGELSADPAALVTARIASVLDDYARACGMTAGVRPPRPR